MAFIEEHQYSIWEEGWKQPKPPMNVLVACEESQAVCKAFRARGHNAFSCDIQECSGGHPEWHIKGDVLKLLKAHWMSGFRGLNGEEYWGYEFETQDGCYHYIMQKWDLIIAHPPCTYLTGAGACNIPKDPSRIRKGQEAAAFFEEMLNADCKMIAIENPPPMNRFEIPDYTQMVRPYMFGDASLKPICLWLKGLPNLLPETSVKPDVERCVWTYKKTGEKKSCTKWYNTDTKNHSKHRSKTFPGIAKAMAEQWG